MISVTPRDRVHFIFAYNNGDVDAKIISSAVLSKIHEFVDKLVNICEKFRNAKVYKMIEEKELYTFVVMFNRRIYKNRDFCTPAVYLQVVAFTKDSRLVAKCLRAGDQCSSRTF